MQLRNGNERTQTGESILSSLSSYGGKGLARQCNARPRWCRGIEFCKKKKGKWPEQLRHRGRLTVAEGTPTSSTPPTAEPSGGCRGHRRRPAPQKEPRHQEPQRPDLQPVLLGVGGGAATAEGAGPSLRKLTPRSALGAGRALLGLYNHGIKARPPNHGSNREETHPRGPTPGARSRQEPGGTGKATAGGRTVPRWCPHTTETPGRAAAWVTLRHGRLREQARPPNPPGGPFTQ